MIVCALVTGCGDKDDDTAVEDTAMQEDESTGSENDND